MLSTLKRKHQYPQSVKNAYLRRVFAAFIKMAYFNYSPFAILQVLLILCFLHIYKKVYHISKRSLCAMWEFGFVRHTHNTLVKKKTVNENTKVLKALWQLYLTY